MKLVESTWDGHPDTEGVLFEFTKNVPISAIKAITTYLDSLGFEPYDTLPTKGEFRCVYLVFSEKKYRVDRMRMSMASKFPNAKPEQIEIFMDKCRGAIHGRNYGL